MVKTNALRILDKKKITYNIREYNKEEIQERDNIFKTLVLIGDKTGHLVACIPVDHEVDLKKLAKLSHNKKVEMIPQIQLLPITGYIHGGCSPVGMKKQFPTYIQDTNLDHIYVSAGKVGLQMYIKVEDLMGIIPCIIGDIIKE